MFSLFSSLWTEQTVKGRRESSPYLLEDIEVTFPNVHSPSTLLTVSTPLFLLIFELGIEFILLTH